jgi:hypothetical protein
MKKPTLRERLLSKAVINWETGCWEWTACLSTSGYGRINANGRVENAHRVAYELIESPIPVGLFLDHLCRNRACINPAHLEPVTNRENILRSPINQFSLKAAQTHCGTGHEFTVENTRVRANGTRACRACERESNKRYRAAHPDQMREYDRNYKRRMRAARKAVTS